MRPPKRWNRRAVDDTDELIEILEAVGLTNPNMVGSGITLPEYKEQVAAALTAAGVKATADAVSRFCQASPVPGMIVMYHWLITPHPNCPVYGTRT
ncbi:hypothetical protein [Mycolicibacterium diernhoferi]|uniref:Uncharacterized protein n=1 Tax=Mycolicibacterium diernhoferi TaxID=1801 RepID=A0A1Q4HKZ8_9MYCO|nr:hypothetical protein [Mycolicibacterium diernhoferi]OJZ68183.1 hypothetical protein BRW64_00885 [Mycolicibacterium diernhoferi]OPE55751.1 hypothetical protein BV510_03395 [Mycolicibacterium diernhoferi]PEG56257.1 hypothetical protein CRI78_02505 [Mycolicibacterium diernhoferi]QYL21329.1 hypothetical protein K0O62_20185 [Mycolicibacterium diernhoferi]